MPVFGSDVVVGTDKQIQNVARKTGDEQEEKEDWEAVNA